MIQIHLNRGWREDTENLSQCWSHPSVKGVESPVAVYSTAQVTDFSKKHQLPAVPVLFVGSRGGTAQTMILGCTPQHMFCINFSIPSGSSSLFSFDQLGQKPHNTSLAPLEQSRIRSTLPWSQACLLCRLLRGNLAEGIVVKPWDCETLMDERPIFKIKIQEFQEGEGSATSSRRSIHEIVSPVPRSMRIAWPRRPAKWVLWPMYGAGRSAFEAAWCSKAQQMLGPVDLAVWIHFCIFALRV